MQAAAVKRGKSMSLGRLLAGCAQSFWQPAASAMI
jgi:hypothetical protein